jgi:hypothetical protein
MGCVSLKININMNSTRLDLIKDGEVVIIVRKNSQPFKVIEKNVSRKVRGFWLLTGEEIILDGGEATLPTDKDWILSLIEKLENDKIEIDKRIKAIKAIN